MLLILNGDEKTILNAWNLEIKKKKNAWPTNVFTKSQDCMFCICLIKTLEFLLFSYFYWKHFIGEFSTRNFHFGIVGPQGIFKPSHLTTFNSRSPSSGNAEYISLLHWWKFKGNLTLKTMFIILSKDWRGAL